VHASRPNPWLLAAVVLLGGLQAASAADEAKVTLEDKKASYILKLQNLGQGTVHVTGDGGFNAKLVNARDTVTLTGGRTYTLTIQPAVKESWRTMDISVVGDTSGMGFGSFTLAGPCKLTRETALSDWDKAFVVKDKQITIKPKK